MALAIRSNSTITYSSRTNTTVSAPSGIVNGDILVATIFVAATGSSPSVTAPTGFTEISISPTSVSSAGFYGNLHVYWKRAASESGSYTFTHTTASTECVMIAVSGALTSGSPIDVSSANTGIAGTETNTGLTLTSTNELVLYLSQNWGDSNTGTAPTGYTQTYNGTVVYTASKNFTSSGATGSTSRANGNNSGDPWGVILVAILPAVIITNPSTVTIDATGTETLQATSVYTFNYTGLTSTAALTGGYGAILVLLNIQGTGLDPVTVVYDPTGANQSMTQLGKIGGTADTSCYLFGLLNPTTYGNKTIVPTWSSSIAECYIQAVSLIGVLQTSISTAFTNYNSASGSSTSPSVNITSTSSGLVFGQIGVDSFTPSLNSVTKTQLYIDNTHAGSGAEYATGTGSAISMGGTLSTSGPWVIQGINVVSSTYISLTYNIIFGSNTTFSGGH